MSCDGNTSAYCERAGAIIAPALGVSSQEAKELLLQIHELGTTRAETALAARGRLEGNGQGAEARHAALLARAADTAAEEATVEIFSEMQVMIPRLAVPAHGDAHPEYGFPLPRRPAQYGWQEVRDLRRAALAAARAGTPPAQLLEELSPLAREVCMAQIAQRGAPAPVPTADGTGAPSLGMARRSNHGPDAVKIEVDGQIIDITGSSFGEILTAIKALPGVDGRCFNADRDGRGKRWVIPGKRAAVEQALHGYGMTVDGQAPPPGIVPVPLPQPVAAPTVPGDDHLVAIANGAAGAQARAYLDAQVPTTWVGARLPRPVQTAGMAYVLNPGDPKAQRAFAQALLESQNATRCAGCGQFEGQSGHNCPLVPGSPGAHQATSLNGWAQAIAMAPGVRDVASSQTAIDLSTPGPNATADTLLGAAIAVDRGAMPVGVSATPELEAAARAWIASRSRDDARAFAQALIAAETAAAPVVVPAPAAAAPPRPVADVPGAPAARVRTTAPGWAHAVIAADGVRDIADGRVAGGDALRTLIVAAGAVHANLVPEGVAFSPDVRRAAAAMIAAPNQTSAEAFARAIEEESNRAGTQPGTPPVWTARVGANLRTTLSMVIARHPWLLIAANGGLVPASDLPPDGGQAIYESLAVTVQQNTANTPHELVDAAAAFQGNRSSAPAFAQMLAYAAGIQQCGNCGQFIGQGGHACPATAYDPNQLVAALSGMHPAVVGVLGENVPPEVVAATIANQAQSAGLAADPNLGGLAAAIQNAGGDPSLAAQLQGALQGLAPQLQGVLTGAGLGPTTSVYDLFTAAVTGRTAEDSARQAQREAMAALGLDEEAGGDAERIIAGGGLTCQDCGQAMGPGPHSCAPEWLDSYPDDLRDRAEQFLTRMPGLVELANGTRPLGSGPFAATERRALEMYASHMEQVGGVADEPMQTMLEFQDQPYRNAQAFARMIAIAAGMQKCQDCGQFLGSSGHDCPVRLAAVPSDEATLDWLGTLAGSQAVRDAYSLGSGDWGGRGMGGSMSRGFSPVNQRRLWDAGEDEGEGEDGEELGDEEGLDEDEFDQDDAEVDDGVDEYGISDRAAAFWERRDRTRSGSDGRDWWEQDRAEREARDQARIDALLPIARDILAGNVADGALVPTALYIAADAFEARTDSANAAQLAAIIAALAQGQRPRLYGLPSPNRVTAWRALRDAPDLPDLANGLVGFDDGGTSRRQALDEAAAALTVRDDLPETLADALIDYEAQPARYAVDFAGALCAAAGVQQCGKCGQFIGKAQHVCAVVSTNGKVYDANGYDRDGYNRRGFDKEGYNKDGWDSNGFNKQGLDKDGYNRAGFNAQGFRKDAYNDAGFDGSGYSADGRDEQGYDQQGLDADGYDKHGFDANGYDRNGWNKDGQNAAGQSHPFFVPDASGMYGDQFDRDGFDADGYAADGKDLYGYNRGGIGPYGYDRWGFNAEGLDASSRDRGGYLQGLGPDGYDRTGYDKLGLDRNGYTFTGYDTNGLDRSGQERTKTISPKTGKVADAKYNASGWDQFGYDRFGFSKKTGLTAPDAQGQRYNYCGWAYDEAANRCVNPNNPDEWVPHTGWGWDKRPGQFQGWSQGYNGSGYAMPRVVPGARYAPPPPPNDPRRPPTFDAFKQGAHIPNTWIANQGYVPDETKVREYYEKLLKGGRKRSVSYRWLRSEQRAQEDPRAVVGGVPLQCPECGRFTGGRAHACPKVNNREVKAFFSGVVRGGQFDLIIKTPHNPDYVEPVRPPSENIYQGYTAISGRGYVDAEDYNFAGFDVYGFDRDGCNKEGYNILGYDRDGYDRRGYNREGLDRDGNTRPLTLDVVANGLAEGQDPINNRHIAETFSRNATQLVGRPRRVVFHNLDGAVWNGRGWVDPQTREAVGGFATDMQGRIYADPKPLGPDAPNAQQLVSIKAGIYHELGHEMETPMDLWASVLEIMRSQEPQEIEIDLRFAGLGVQTVRLDAGRAFVKDAYNIVEDGRMERRVDDRYAGAGEILAADAQINPRWHENVRDLHGTPLPPKDVVPWALLYEALPFFNVRPSTHAKMHGTARALFDELAPVVRAAVNGRPEDAWTAAVYMAARFEQEGLVMPEDLKATNPGNPPPGTEARRPRIVIEGDQVIDASQMGGGGGGGMDMDVEFTGHVTVKGQMPPGAGEGGGQGIFSGGVTYEEEQQDHGRQYQPAQNHGQQGQNGQQGQQQGQNGGQGQGSGQQSSQQGGDSGDQQGQQGGGRAGGQASDGGGGGGDGQQGQQTQAGGGGGDRQYQSGGQYGDQSGDGGGQTGEDDDTDGPGKGWRRGMGQGDDETNGGGRQGQDEDSQGVGQGRGSGLGEEDGDGQNRSRSGAAGDGVGDQRLSSEGEGDQGTSRRSGDADAVTDADMEGYWKDWNADSDQDAVGAESQGASGGGAGGRGAAPSRRGGSPFRDADAPFTKSQLAGVLAAAEREAVQALDSGIRVESRVEVLGTALHQPLGNRASMKQRFKTSDGRIEGVQVGLPKAGPTTTQRWQQRRGEHKKVAARMATVLSAIREEVEKRLRNLPDGQIDRRRMVRAVAGQQNVRTQSKTLPQTSFRASLAVDLSGSMSGHISSGALYDSTMVLGDCFELLDIPYESRGFGSTDAQFKSMGDPTFDPARAAALTETDLGGTNLSKTAGLAMTALRGGEEANRLFVALSDGQLGDHGETVKVLAEARRRGIVTFGIFLGHGANRTAMDELYGPGNWVQINQLDEMPKAVGQRLAALFNRLAQR